MRDGIARRLEGRCNEFEVRAFRRARVFDRVAESVVVEHLLDRRLGVIEITFDGERVGAGEDADLELWLIEPDADGSPAELVSLGVIDPDRPGDFAVPATTDPSVFSVVDISIEPRDGVPTHSGRSILRGPLINA